MARKDETGYQMYLESEIEDEFRFNTRKSEVSNLWPNTAFESAKIAEPVVSPLQAPTNPFSYDPSYMPGYLSNAIAPDMNNRASEEERPENRTRITKGFRSRKVLPLLFFCKDQPQRVMTGYDTGTHSNHISLKLVSELGYEVDTSEVFQQRFTLPDGTFIEAVGRVIVQVGFAQSSDDTESPVTCHFNVFRKLSLPALVGMTFLMATSTLTTYTSRLIELGSNMARPYRLLNIGHMTNEVACTLSGQQVTANADTGSEIALISGQYARRRKLLLQNNCEELELADGSLVYTNGCVDVVFGIWVNTKTTPSRPKLQIKQARFHVLETLTLDVVLDEHIVSQFDIFGSGFGSCLSSGSGFASALAPIIHLRTVEQYVQKKSAKTREWAAALSNKRTRSTGTASNRALREEIRLLQDINDLDDCEIRRRDLHHSKVAQLVTISAMELEANTKERLRYEAARARLMSELECLTGTGSPLPVTPTLPAPSP